MSGTEYIVGLAAKNVPFDLFLSARSLVAKQKEGTRILEMARDSGLILHREPAIDLKYQLAKLFANSVEVESYVDARYGIILRELAKVEEDLQANPENTFLDVEGLSQRRDTLLAEKVLMVNALHIDPQE